MSQQLLLYLTVMTRIELIDDIIRHSHDIRAKHVVVQKHDDFIQQLHHLSLSLFIIIQIFPINF